MSDQDQQPVSEESVALRAELERVQEAARQALSHLRDEVDYLRGSQNPDRDADSVTAQVALEQELDTVRRSLHEKERVLDETSAQCRRLEDELEDLHLSCDGLKKDLERKQLSLEAARDQVARMSRDRHEIEERYQDLLASRRPEAGRHRAGKTGGIARLIGGLVAGILLTLGAIGAWVRLDPLFATHVRLPGEKETASPAPSPPKSIHQDAAPAKVEDARPIAAEEPPPLASLKRVRDRLSDGSAGPPMLVIENADFTMGRHLALPDEDDGPAHSVRLEGFLISATEVTFDEYDRFARTTGRRLPRDFGWGRGTRPVVDVSWEDARAYTRWLSQRTGGNYRLPSEAEWEYAAQAGQRSFFWWGNQPGQGRAVCYDCGTRWDNRSSAPVGTFAPNPFGLYDTAGNVMEWVQDCYHPNYTGAPADGSPWEADGCSLRVARSGAFNRPARSMQSTARQKFVPETQINALGFRVARDE